jgi:hypothetical protein
MLREGSGKGVRCLPVTGGLRGGPGIPQIRGMGTAGSGYAARRSRSLTSEMEEGRSDPSVLPDSER